MIELQGKKVVVVGLGIEGEDLARYFAEHGAAVTISDLKTPEALAARVERLKPLGVHFALGRNDPADIAGADLVCVSQSVPVTNPAIVVARGQGIQVASMTSLFLDNFPGPVVGITGSSGKTTTTSLVDAIFTAAERPHVVGGNIGIGLMAVLDQGTPDTWAVLGISHTQLVLVERSPQVAGLLRVTPNHLDQFSWDEYVALKQKIFAYQGAADSAVFNLDDPVSLMLLPESRARRFLFSVQRDPGGDGAFLGEDDNIYWRRDDRLELVMPAEEIPLRGFHNVQNVAAATAIAAACDIAPDAVARAVRAFRAPPHRIEFVAKINDVDYYNDSIATAPERTIAALKSFEEPIVLMLGGRDKKLPLDDLLPEIRRRVRVAICFGESGPLFADAVEAFGGSTVIRVETLAGAVEAASAEAAAGNVVLLSPACTSFDAFDNFEQRGIEFARLVLQLQREATR